MASQKMVRVARLGAGEGGQKAHETREVLTPASDALYSNLLCFAAEEARIHHTIVDMADFRQRAEGDADSL